MYLMNIRYVYHIDLYIILYLLLYYIIKIDILYIYKKAIGGGKKFYIKEI